LPKGVYVFEYSTRVQLKGSYQGGIAEIQCVYAPEFNSHTESIALEAKVAPSPLPTRLRNSGNAGHAALPPAGASLALRH
jgi:hypothetical protein